MDSRTGTASTAPLAARLEHLRVVVRLRPPFPRRESGSAVAATVTGDASVCVSLKGSNYECAYDKVFGPDATQGEVYQELRPSVLPVCEGINCTVFAYGQTGTGKTFTMLGASVESELLAARTSPHRGLSSQASPSSSSSSWGIIPRAVADVFAAVSPTVATVYAAYMQIYNDKLYDLLKDGRRHSPLQVREVGPLGGGRDGRDGTREVIVVGLSEYRVSSLEDVLSLLRTGAQNRATRDTDYNDVSSRSHAILRLSVELETRTPGERRTVIRRAKLNLVDLAGSEKWDVSHDAPKLEESHARELASINRSLSALGNCIHALSDKRRRHIPYRDSVLTRLLQDSLGGNTRTTLIATLSPSALCAEESMSTLTFADRARMIMVKVKPNEVVDDAVRLAQARREIARLRALLRSTIGGTVCASCGEILAAAGGVPQMSLKDDPAFCSDYATGAESDDEKWRGSQGARGSPAGVCDDRGAVDSDGALHADGDAATTEDGSCLRTVIDGGGVRCDASGDDVEDSSGGLRMSTPSHGATGGTHDSRILEHRLQQLTEQVLGLVQQLAEEEKVTLSLRSANAELVERLSAVDDVNAARHKRLTAQLHTCAIQNKDLCDLLQNEERKSQELQDKVGKLEKQRAAAEAARAATDATARVAAAKAGNSQVVLFPTAAPLDYERKPALPLVGTYHAREPAATPAVPSWATGGATTLSASLGITVPSTFGPLRHVVESLPVLPSVASATSAVEEAFHNAVASTYASFGSPTHSLPVPSMDGSPYSRGGFSPMPSASASSSAHFSTAAGATVQRPPRLESLLERSGTAGLTLDGVSRDMPGVSPTAAEGRPVLFGGLPSARLTTAGYDTHCVATPEPRRSVSPLSPPRLSQNEARVDMLATSVSHASPKRGRNEGSVRLRGGVAHGHRGERSPPRRRQQLGGAPYVAPSRSVGHERGKGGQGRGANVKHDAALPSVHISDPRTRFAAAENERSVRESRDFVSSALAAAVSALRD